MLGLGLESSAVADPGFCKGGFRFLDFRTVIRLFSLWWLF